jgi:hypothetical protein
MGGRSVRGGARRPPCHVRCGPGASLRGGLSREGRISAIPDRSGEVGDGILVGGRSFAILRPITPR